MSARLTKDVKSEIVDVLTDHAFKERRDFHRKWKNELAEAAWREKYSPEQQKFLLEAPAGFFAEVNDFHFKVDGRTLRLNRLERYHRVGYDHRSDYFLKEISPELYARLSEYKSSLERVESEVIAAQSHATGALARFTTYKSLREGWPELVTLCPNLVTEPRDGTNSAIPRRLEYQGSQLHLQTSRREGDRGMITIRARNVGRALPEALRQLRRLGVERDSRNGPVRMFPEPVATVYERPDERVMFWPERDANPFFHLYESLWMLGGWNDVESVARYVERMRTFSDDGRKFHGAYGYRWVHHFGFNQLDTIIEALQNNPDDRRQVLSMWDASADLGRQGKDLPCNLQATFQVACDGRLDMMVTNRSNDMVWGAYGANAVHFSYLHEYVARCAGYAQGVYRQVSANFHAYKGTLALVQRLADEAEDPIFTMAFPDKSWWADRDPYEETVSPFPLMTLPKKEWDDELDAFLNSQFEKPGVRTRNFQDPFFEMVAQPMSAAYFLWRDKSDPYRYTHAFEVLDSVVAPDWKKAGREWLLRRHLKEQSK